MADQIPDDLGPELNAEAARYSGLRRLADAQKTVARGPDVDRDEWNDAQQTALWELQNVHHGGGGEHMRELVDWDEPDRDTSADDDEADDFTADAYVVESATGRGWIRRQA